jgi:secondary thiamine-phosphate synthase enzyme
LDNLLRQHLHSTIAISTVILNLSSRGELLNHFSISPLQGENMTNGKLTISTAAHMQLVDITAEVEKNIRNLSISSGILYLFNPHTTAGLTINEGADPDVCRDIIKGLEHIVPRNLDYRHMEGNSPSHLMAMLCGSSLTVFIENSRLVLGTWQKIYFCEFDGPRTRFVNWKIIPDTI